VDIRAGIMPLEVLKDDAGRARGLRMCRCTMDGMRPVPIAETEFEIPCDLVVAAIGQSGNLEGLTGLDDGRGFIKADRNLAVPGRPGEFVGGDIVRPHLLTTAIGHGRIAAESIDGFLRGEEPGRRPRVDVVHFDMIDRLAAAGHAPEAATGPIRGTAESDFAVHNYEDRSAHEIIPHEALFLGHFGAVPRHVRSHRKVGEAVLGDFGERLVPLSTEEAIAEAKRCMSCGLCLECDNCLIYCPQDAIARVPKAERAPGRYVETDYAKCVGCHICRDVCPSGYIQMGLGE
jgi:Pyruvate/2-oxoacid:ferredoxin oxidoreductase delta subunit